MPEQKFIEIRGAREHNLKSIDIDIPRDKLVVITGLSGSGKSSLAFDTIYAEGQRRYVESLSGLCAAVPRHDAEAGRRPYHRPVAGDLDRAEDHLEEPALDRRHRHRDLRLPAAAVRAGRHALLARRPGCRSRRSRSARWSTSPWRCPRGRAPTCWRRSCATARASTARSSPDLLKQGFQRVKVNGDVPRPRRAARARQEVPAQHRRRRRPHRRARGAGDPARRLACAPRSTSPTASPSSRRRRRRRGRRTARSRSGSPSRRTSPARSRASPSPRSSRGSSRSTRRSAPARPATGSGSSCSSTRGWWCRTRA